MQFAMRREPLNLIAGHGLEDRQRRKAVDEVVRRNRIGHEA
jgi:hypothetical protein